MKTPEQEHLLRDVLDEDESYIAFRAELRNAMLAEVRRTHRSRGKQLLALAACVAIGVTLVCLLWPHTPDTIQAPPVAIVRSVPLKPGQIVRTANHNPNVTLVQSQTIEVLVANMEVVRTVGELPANVLTDEQLLDLFKGRAVALVNLTTGKKLVFLDEQ